MRPRYREDAGFNILDLLVVMSIFAVLAAMAVPAIKDVTGGLVHGQAQQAVESELQQARLKAVTTNRILRVRFNCPSPGQFRILELIGTPAAPTAADTATNRCSPTAFPFPAPDANGLTLPNLDGPVKWLDSRVTFGAAPTIEFRPSGGAYTVNADGTSAPITGGEASITLVKGDAIRIVKVNSVGKVQGVQ